MNIASITLLVALTAPAQAPVTPVPAAMPAAPNFTQDPATATLCQNGTLANALRERQPLESDHAFDNFINPVSNPVFAKDPRSSTWARALFINNNFPGSHPFQGGNAQVYAMQVNVALSERLTFIADKDGYASIKPRAGAASDGWLNLAAGLKYTFIRDVENQFLMAGGLMYEIPSGEADAFQNHGGGMFTTFITYGKEFGCHWHVIGNHGFSFAANTNENNNFFYHSLHLDREIGGWFYPLVEVNWFQYTTGDAARLPQVVNEGDGLLNLGTAGHKGKQLFTAAAGAKVKLTDSIAAGCAYEFPLSDYKGLINNRVTVDLTIRY